MGHIVCLKLLIGLPETDIANAAAFDRICTRQSGFATCAYPCSGQYSTGINLNIDRCNSAFNTLALYGFEIQDLQGIRLPVSTPATYLTAAFGSLDLTEPLLVIKGTDLY